MVEPHNILQELLDEVKGMRKDFLRIELNVASLEQDRARSDKVQSRVYTLFCAMAGVVLVTFLGAVNDYSTLKNKVETIEAYGSKRLQNLEPRILALEVKLK
ncbi:MAG: hypothetical protein EBR82_42080 [Caulobacteraceae bacterium]|nr:hypothetical protein [Caulobacteraceae bacterium]